jgi:hypothetical protein
MKVQSVILVSLLFTNLLRGQEPALHIAVIAGEGATHNINVTDPKKDRVQPVVQVEDENGKSIAGAAVIFSLPPQGPGGTFINGSQTLTVTTDAQGRAIARGIRVNRLTGNFSIRVTASYQGHTATATIAQSTVATPIHTSGAFGVPTKEWVIVAVGALAIVGGVIAVKTFGPGANSNSLTLTPGTPVIGGPQ